MGFIQNLQQRIHQYYLRQKLKKNTKVERFSVQFEKAKHIGILYDATESEHHHVVAAYRQNLLNDGKLVEMLAFIDDKEDHDQEFFKYFNRKNLSWTLEPKGAEIDQFINTPFDILLNLHIQPVQPLEYISILSKARLRVGKYRNNAESFYDLMIDIAENDSLNNFIGQVDYMIKRINKG